MRNEFQLQIILTIFFWSSFPPLFCKTSLSISERIWHAKKTLGRFRKVLQIIKDEIIDDVDNDDNINNDDDEHSGSPILKRLMRPKVFRAHHSSFMNFICWRSFVILIFFQTDKRCFVVKYIKAIFPKKFTPISTILNHLFGRKIYFKHLTNKRFSQCFPSRQE